MNSNFCAARELGLIDSGSDPCDAAVSALLDKEREGRERGGRDAGMRERSR